MPEVLKNHDGLIFSAGKNMMKCLIQRKSHRHHGWLALMNEKQHPQI